MQIVFEGQLDYKEIPMAAEEIGTLSYKNDVYTIQVGNYKVIISQMEMKRLSTIYGYTTMHKKP